MSVSDLNEGRNKEKAKINIRRTTIFLYSAQGVFRSRLSNRKYKSICSPIGVSFFLYCWVLSESWANEQDELADMEIFRIRFVIERSVPKSNGCRCEFHHWYQRFDNMWTCEFTEHFNVRLIFNTFNRNVWWLLSQFSNQRLCAHCAYRHHHVKCVWFSLREWHNCQFQQYLVWNSHILGDKRQMVVTLGISHAWITLFLSQE